MAMRKASAAGRRAADTPPIDLTVNGQVYQLSIGSRPGEVEPFHTLSHTLRETLGFTGTKRSCDNGACGCCTVIMDGKAVLSCKILTAKALLNENPHPREDEVKEALSGNFCRCVSHYHVLRAVMSVADRGR
jgi:aerobic-type carbon monoxide dehydrogenase small subunit (CoxS/CutS family)